MDGHKVKPVPVRMLLPHEVLHCFAVSQADMVFDSVMCGNLSDSARCSFWNHLRTLKPWQRHPSLADGNGFERLLGFTFHMDGAQMYNEDEFVVWSFSSCFSESGLIRDVLAFQYPFCVIPHRHMRTPQAP